MKNVLLPTDFSDNAMNAIRYTMRLFEREKVTFYLLNTFTPISYHTGYLIENPTMYGMEDVAMMNSKRDIERTEDKIKEEFDTSNFTFVRCSTFNTLIGEIREMVVKKHIDLIIMGTKGATGAKEVFIGTHTMYTIKKAKCPVLAVPANFKYEAPFEILFPTDFKLDSANEFLPIIKTICKTHGSRLNILNAYYGVTLDKDQEKVKTYLDKYFKTNAHIFHVAEGMDVLEAIDDFQKKIKINLLVMIHNRHSFFENLLFKPVINQIAYHTNVPFLVIPSEKRLLS
ncbi:universal stress protein [Aquimarina sp. W85]|uniref:universal stress protein n=1 Tax=Aquimarina rhodophyticola TaxID=3342246 RepID=UPI003672CE3B